MSDFSATPHDHLDPEWGVADRVHCWRNYIDEEVREMWGTFTPAQRAALARGAQRMADNEDWD